jgi:hypothetical protein
LSSTAVALAFVCPSSRGLLLQTYQVRPPQLVHGLGVVQLNVQVLVHALERAADLDLVLEFHRDFMLDERLEEATRPLALLSV